MHYFLSFEENISLQTFLAIMVSIVVIGLLVLVIRSVLIESKKYKLEMESFIDGLETKREIYANISTYMNRSNNQEFSLVQIDIDKYTEFVETFGKDDAERITKNLALHILDALPNRVELSRTGLDRFLVFLKGEYDQKVVTQIALKLLDIVREPIKLFGETTINLTASIAIVYYPTHGNNLKQLEESLDIGNYVCKKNGGNQVKVYNSEQGSEESANMQYYKQIKAGIDNKEFALYYQPIVNSETNTVYAIEGLMRWNHPELGLLSPYKFINIMEQTGDIKWVGEWGLEQLLKEYLSTKKLSFQHEEYRFSLNLSPKQLSDANLSQSFSKLLKKYKVNANEIILEISEFTIFDKHDVITKNIANLKEMGFKIAVDGYGLDINGIKRIEELGIEIVKLDKENMDPENDAFLKRKFISMLVEVADKANRDLVIIAEGVENPQAVKYANDLGIKILQGYNYAKPMSADELEKYLKKKEFIKSNQIVDEPTPEVTTPAEEVEEA